MSLEIKPNTTTVLLFQGDDLDPMNEHAQAIEAAVKSAPVSRVGDGASPIHDSVHAFDEFMAAAVDRALKVRLTQMPRKQYRTLRNEHPARMRESEDGPVVSPDDAPWGFNRDTFGDALVPLSVDMDQFDGETSRDEFLDNLSDGWFNKLYSAAVTLNQSSGPTSPKAPLSLHLAPTSDETSTSPERLA